MVNVIVVFPKIEEAKRIKNVLVRNGFSVIAACSTAAQALNHVDDLHFGILVCGYKLPDMMYSQLKAYCPASFEMLLLASENLLAGCSDKDIICVGMPLKVHDLLNTLEMMCINMERKRKKERGKPKVRNQQDIAIIQQSKRLLMERNNMSEEEAHYYLQKTSMDSGNSIVETAQMVISISKI
jgi:Response regulator with putative antiterminator output domain